MIGLCSWACETLRKKGPSSVPHNLMSLPGHRLKCSLQDYQSDGVSKYSLVNIKILTGYQSYVYYAYLLFYQQVQGIKTVMRGVFLIEYYASRHKLTLYI